MAAIDDTRTLGRARLDFASEHDIDEFVETLQKFESGDMPADQWRRFRLVRGTYGQRQDGVQMLRVKAPQGIVSSSQMRAFAGVASRYSRGFCHITTRQNIQFHFVLLKNVESAMRELADEGLTTREACGNSVRNITGCPYAGTSENEIFDPTPYAEATTRYFLRHPLSGVLPRKFKIAFEGCTEDHAVTSINDIGWRARIVNGRKGWKVTVAGGTSIMPVNGYVLYEFLPVEEMLEVAEAIVRAFHKYGDYQHPQRNRMKFVIRAIGWDAFRAKFEEELEGFRREGGARLPFDPAKTAPEQAPDWEPAAPPTLQHVAAMASTPMRGPGIYPGTVRLQPLSDTYVRWLRRNVTSQRQNAFYHVTVRLPLGDFTAGQMRVLADLAEAYADGSMRLTVGQIVLVGGGPSDQGAQFGKVVAKIPARRITGAAGRLIDLYREQRQTETEDLGAFYRRIAPSVATERLKDLVEVDATQTTPDDFIDLGESQAFDPVVMDGECSA